MIKPDLIHSLINPEHVLIVFVDLEYEVLYALKRKNLDINTLDLTACHSDIFKMITTNYST